MGELPKSLTVGGAVPVSPRGSRTGRLADDGTEECARLSPPEKRCTALAWAVVRRLHRLNGIDVILALPSDLTRKSGNPGVVLEQRAAAVRITCADDDRTQTIEVYPTFYPLTEELVTRIRAGLEGVTPEFVGTHEVHGLNNGRAPCPIREGGSAVRVSKLDEHSVTAASEPTGQAGNRAGEPRPDNDIDYLAWVRSLPQVHAATAHARQQQPTAIPRLPRLDQRTDHLLGTFFGSGWLVLIEIYPAKRTSLEALRGVIHQAWTKDFGTGSGPPSAAKPAAMTRPVLPKPCPTPPAPATPKLEPRRPQKPDGDQPAPVSIPLIPESTESPPQVLMQQLESWIRRLRGVLHADLDNVEPTDGPPGNATELKGTWVVLKVRIGGALGTFRIFPQKGAFDGLTTEDVLGRLAESLLERLRSCPLLERAAQSGTIASGFASTSTDRPPQPNPPVASRRTHRPRRIGPPDPPTKHEPSYRHLVEHPEARWIGDDLTIGQACGRVRRFHDGSSRGIVAYQYLLEHGYLTKRPEGLFTIHVVPGYAPKAVKPRDGEEAAGAADEAQGVTFFTGVPAVPRRRTQPARPEPAPGALSMPRPDPSAQEAVRPEAEAGKQVADDEQVDNPVGVVPAERKEKGVPEEMKKRRGSQAAQGPVLRGRPMTYDDMPEAYRPVYRTALKSGRANASGTWVDVTGFWGICVRSDSGKAGQICYDYFMRRRIAYVVRQDGTERMHRLVVLPGYKARGGSESDKAPSPAKRAGRRPRADKDASALDGLPSSVPTEVQQYVEAIRVLAAKLRGLGCEVNVSVKVPVEFHV